MNYQGGSIGQVNCNNANIQNEVNPHLSIETSETLLPSSSLVTDGNDQMFSDQLFRPNINLPQQSGSAPLHESPNRALGLGIYSPSSHNRLSESSVLQYQGNGETNSSINLDLSSSLTHASSGMENQGATRSTLNAINNVSLGYEVEEQDMQGDISTNTLLLPTKRKSINHISREHFTGESSSANNNNETTSSNPDMQTQPGEAAQANIIANPEIISAITSQSFMPADIISNSYARGVQASLPSQAPLFIQNGSPPFFGSSETSEANSSQEQLVLDPNFLGVLRSSTWFNSMNSRNAPRAIMPPYSLTGIEVVAPLHGIRSIQGSNTLDPQVERTIQANRTENFQFVDETANFLGNVSNHPQQNGSLITGSNGNISNNPSGVHLLSNPNEPMQILSGNNIDDNGRVSHAQEIVLPGQSIEGSSTLAPSSQSSQEMNLPIATSISRIENQHDSAATSTLQVNDNTQPIIHPMPSFSNPEIRRRLSTRVRSLLDQLRRGRTVRYEEGQLDDALLGLTTAEIMFHLRYEKFKSTDEKTPENTEVCCICQEDYVDGEEVGKLDCMHKFHVKCIKQWLVHKNICPICKRMALATYDAEIEPLPDTDSDDDDEVEVGEENEVDDEYEADEDDN